MVKFNLKPGMRNQEFYNEVVGNISGETRQQVQKYLSVYNVWEPGLESDLITLMSCPIYHMQKEGEQEITHRVLAVDRVNGEDYALIEKRYCCYLAECSHCNKKHKLPPWYDFRIQNYPEYFLMGINEDDNDQKYFMHPLQLIPDILVSKKDLKEILEWVNRVDEGYEGRIQGDIIYHFAKIQDHTCDPKVSCYCQGGDYNNILYKNRYPKADMFRDILISAYEQAFGKDAQLSEYVEVVNLEKLRQKNLKRMSIGNSHDVSTDGYITTISISRLLLSRLALRNVFMVIGGSYVVMVHPEHKTVTKDIPNGMALILTIQRGSINDGLDD